MNECDSDALVAMQTVSSLHSQARSTHRCVGNHVNEYTSIVSRINTVCMNATAMLVTLSASLYSQMQARIHMRIAELLHIPVSLHLQACVGVGTCTLCIMCVYCIRSIACYYCLVINWW